VKDHQKAYPWAVLKKNKTTKHRSEYVAVTSTHIRCYSAVCFKGADTDANNARWRQYETKMAKTLADLVESKGRNAWKKRCEDGDEGNTCRKSSFIPVVLMGDFNSRYRAEFASPALALANKGYTDTRLELKQEGTFDVDEDNEDDSDRVCSGLYATRNVKYGETVIYDYVFYKWKPGAGGSRSGALQNRLVTYLDSVRASDHRMISVKVGVQCAVIISRSQLRALLKRDRECRVVCWRWCGWCALASLRCRARLGTLSSRSWPVLGRKPSGA
jgi:hypothetical protein